MQLSTEHAPSQPHRIPLVPIAVFGSLAVLIVLALAAALAPVPANSREALVFERPPERITPDPLALQKAWYRPYPSAEGVGWPVPVQTVSVLDDPLLFAKAWYAPWPEDSDEPAAWPPADPFEFHAAWYQPYPPAD